MTAVRFSGGEVIEVNLSLDEVRKLLQDALEQKVLLELESQDGESIVINPQQVQFLQNGSVEAFLPATSPASSITSSS